MLIQRIITASILASLIALAVFKLPSDYFSALLALITLMAAWEWCHLANFKSVIKRVVFFTVLIIPMLGIHFWTQILEIAATLTNWPEIRDYSGILEWLMVPPVLFWILVMVLIRNTPQGVLNVGLQPRYKALIGWGVLLSSWLFLTRMRVFYGSEMTMYFLILIWVADIAAYFAGKKYGKIKLAPEISPGKTTAGMYGALFSGIICGLVLSLIYGFPLMIASDFVLLSALTVLISIYGDLFFSAAKRRRGVKDSGSLLPGHGGVLDRIDSIIAATPFFYAGIFLIYKAVL